MGSINTVVVGDAGALTEAMAIVREQIGEIDQACSRFREDSELSSLNRQSGEGEVVLSPLLEEAIVAALHTAEMTNGLVDLTVGRSMEELGYTVTFRDVPSEGPAVRIRLRRAVGWRSLEYNRVAHTVKLPAGVSLDLGASGKAWAADRSANAVLTRLGTPVAVDCGGDIAVRGQAPEGGWPVRVAASVGAEDWQDVAVFDGGLATSGTTARRWRRGNIELHHIIDPATGLPARTPWAMVSAAAATCVEANAAATAAVILGVRAPAWLEELTIPARLVAVTGDVRFTGGWDKQVA
jgi:thiamine biosynthesis lipoprotein ApbE